VPGGILLLKIVHALPSAGNANFELHKSCSAIDRNDKGDIMKTSDTITTIFRHNLWANLRLLEECSDLNSEQLDATISGTYGSIHDTFQHIARSERSYFSRISTGRRYHHPEDAKPMSISEMMASVRETGIGLVEWAQKVQAEDTVLIDWDGTPREVPKTIILNQVINHATEHRAQIMVILTQLGIQPPELDSWTYFDELENKSWLSVKSLQ